MQEQTRVRNEFEMSENSQRLGGKGSENGSLYQGGNGGTKLVSSTSLLVPAAGSHHSTLTRRVSRATTIESTGLAHSEAGGGSTRSLGGAPILGFACPEVGRGLTRAPGGAAIPPPVINAGKRWLNVHRRQSGFSGRTDLSQQQLQQLQQQQLYGDKHITYVFENTYQLGPDPEYRFCSYKVQAVLRGILVLFLEAENYDAKKCSQITRNLSEVIKTRMKEMSYKRYKFVCNVVIGQHSDQSLQYSSRCIWDTKTDNSASASYKNRTLFAVATVFGVYYE